MAPRPFPRRSGADRRLDRLPQPGLCPHRHPRTSGRVCRGETFKYSEFPIDQAFNTGDSEVGRTGRVSQLTFSTTEKESSTKDYGYDTPIPQSDIDEAARLRAEKRSNYDPRAAAVEGITDQLDNDREVRVASICQDPSNYDATRRIVMAGNAKFLRFRELGPLRRHR